MRSIKREQITLSFSECNSIIFEIETSKKESNPIHSKYKGTDGTKCCREEGVPDYCFGYCLTGRKNTASRAITGACKEWLKEIGDCSKGLLISYIHKFL